MLHFKTLNMTKNNSLHEKQNNRIKKAFLCQLNNRNEIFKKEHSFPEVKT